MHSKFLDAHESLESHGVSTMVSASLAQVPVITASRSGVEADIP